MPRIFCPVILSSLCVGSGKLPAERFSRDVAERAVENRGVENSGQAVAERRDYAGMENGCFINIAIEPPMQYDTRRQ